MNGIEKIQAALKNSDFDAVLISSPHNVKYAVDFRASFGILLATSESYVFITDSRYEEAAHKAGISNIEISRRGRNYLDIIRNFTEKYNVEILGFEKKNTTCEEYEKLISNTKARLKAADDIINSARICKTEAEKKRIIKAQRITELAFNTVLTHIKEGVTEIELAAELVYQMQKNGAERMSFEPIVASGENGSMPHAVPTARRVRCGDFITMDIGCVYDGYCSDMTRTVALGDAGEEMRRIYNIVLRAQKAGIENAVIGMKCSDIDESARDIIECAGYGAFFGHSLGHGVGVEVHEQPNLSPLSNAVLNEGAVVTVEPGIYIPKIMGVRIEDMLFVGKNKTENLTLAPKDLIIL